ncbi:MAG: hypothetical protein CSA18_02880 [Deltaproteobacteria bacterium]|nr:MAG: hypothetical protein CSA18_02880 [Deltaproteobacteria bacterium]
MSGKINKILYATDLSEPAKEAMKYSIDLALHYKASMTVIHVVPNVFEELALSTGVEMELYVGIDRWQEIEKKRFENAEQTVLERIDEITREIIGDSDNFKELLTDIQVRIGHPVNEIINLCKEGNYDIIVMATHGHGQLGELLVGSVSRGVLKKSKVPVFLVPIKS